MGDVVYTAGHPHECGMVGFRPETNPRTWQWAMADRQARHPGAQQRLRHRTPTGTTSTGCPAAEILHWLPTFSPGTYTGSGQAGWSVAANDQYVVYGGEFPRVNGINQQGLVRFAGAGRSRRTTTPIQGYPELPR